MPVVSKKHSYKELEAAARFTPGTRNRIQRALRRTVTAPSSAHDALRNAVRLVVDELLAEGVDPSQVESILLDVVSEAGSVYGAYTQSIVSRSPRWRLVEENVTRWSRYDVEARQNRTSVPSENMVPFSPPR